MGAEVSLPVEPETAEEWQEAVDVAELYLLLESARQYGLIEGGHPLLSSVVKNSCGADDRKDSSHSQRASERH